jgi:hypothetical protein
VLNEVVSRDPLVLRHRCAAPEIELANTVSCGWISNREVTDEALEEVLENLRQRRALIERPIAPPAWETCWCWT